MISLCLVVARGGWASANVVLDDGIEGYEDKYPRVRTARRAISIGLLRVARVQWTHLRATNGIESLLARTGHRRSLANASPARASAGRS